MPPFPLIILKLLLKVLFHIDFISFSIQRHITKAVITLTYKCTYPVDFRYSLFLIITATQQALILSIKRNSMKKQFHQFLEQNLSRLNKKRTNIFSPIQSTFTFFILLDKKVHIYEQVKNQSAKNNSIICFLI